MYAIHKCYGTKGAYFIKIYGKWIVRAILGKKANFQKMTVNIGGDESRFLPNWEHIVGVVTP